MTLSCFDPNKRKVLFFSRGRGRGHAIPDIEIARALMELRVDAEILFVSYGLGGETLSAAGFPLIDTGLPDTSPIAETTAISGKLIGILNPDLVVAHEEFSVAPAAKIFDKRVIFIVDFFTDSEMYSMNALKFADTVLFTGRCGVFEEPLWLKGKVKYVGPVLRTFRYTRENRLRLRAELKIPESAFVVSVFPGSWDEAQTPAADLIANAFDALPFEEKRLLWVEGKDPEGIGYRLQGREGIEVLPFSFEIDRLMCVSDVAVTKSNRMTVFELDALGIPSLALSYGLNALDEQAITGLPTVRVLQAKRLEASLLARELMAVERPASRLADRDSCLSASRICAETLSAALG